MKIVDTHPKLEYIQGLGESLRRTPHDAELWANVGDTLTEAGRFETAVHAYDMALLLEPQLHRAQLGLIVALDICDANLAARERPKMRSTMWEVLQAIETLILGLREGRRPLFIDVHALRLRKATNRRLAENPNDPDALFLRSAFLAKQGAFKDAIECLDALARAGIAYPGASEFRRQLRGEVESSAPHIARRRK